MSVGLLVLLSNQAKLTVSLLSNVDVWLFFRAFPGETALRQLSS